MPAHRMTLRGPWQYEWLSPPLEAGNEAGVPATGRVKMPAEWRCVFGERAGRVRFTRRFGRPTNLESHERVFVAFDGAGGECRIACNDREVGSLSAEENGRFEVTGLLEANNRLVVEVAFDPQQQPEARGGLWAPVAVEIEQDF